MSEPRLDSQSQRFGKYLRSVRETRKLSLDAVEEMSFSLPGRVTKSHLSRIENGQAEPTFPRMFALSQIYGVPISTLAERFEKDLRQAMRPAEIDDRANDAIYREAEERRSQGRYQEALLRYEILIDRRARSNEAGVATVLRSVELTLRRITCLVQLKRYSVAREQSEETLGDPELSDLQRAQTLFLFVQCCYHTERLSIAKLVMETTEQLIRGLPPESALHAKFDHLVGLVAIYENDHAAAAEAFRRTREALSLRGETFEACRARINYATELIELRKPREARRQLGISLDEARRLGYNRQVALSLSTLGMLSYREGDTEAAESNCLKSNAVARVQEFISLVFRNCFYLWKIATARGDTAAANTHERTLRAYLGRMEKSMVEAIEYRAHLAGGEK